MDGYDWTVKEDPEQTAAALTRLSLLITQVDELHTALDGGPSAARRGSAFRGDDAVLGVSRASGLCWTPIAVAIDHLSLLGLVFRSPGPLNPIAPYTLLRPAIESAAWTIWMLASSNRDERVTRMLQFLYLDEGSDGTKLAAARGVGPTGSRTTIEAYIREVASRRPAINVETVLKRAPKSTEVLKVAASQVDDGQHEAVLWWTMLSGLSHGRPHGLLSLLQREEIVPSGTNTHTLSLTVSPAAISVGVEIGIRFVNTALLLHTQRSMGIREWQSFSVHN